MHYAVNKEIRLPQGAVLTLERNIFSENYGQIQVKHSKTRTLLKGCVSSCKFHKCIITKKINIIIRLNAPAKNLLNPSPASVYPCPMPFKTIISA